MSDSWVISDTHFRHESLLTFVGKDGELVRGKHFKSINEHDEQLIERWNNVVKPADIVYHLGDVVTGTEAGKEWFIKNFSRLHGTKILIVGNHDNIEFFASTKLFNEIRLWKMLVDFKLILSHVPLHQQSAMLWGSKDTGLRDNPLQLLNVHGHLHENPSPSGPYRCVSVEQTDYAPVNIEDLKIK